METEINMGSKLILLGDASSNLIIILSSSISSILVFLLVLFVVIYSVRKGFLCAEKKNSNDEVIVHQNELYGNISNQDYFDERYDTNVTDRNEDYEQYEYTGWQYNYMYVKWVKNVKYDKNSNF